MDNFDDNRKMKSEIARWIKNFAFMKDEDFNNLDTSTFTVIQKVAYNYVEKSKTDTKTTEKIIKLVQWYDAGFWSGLN